MLTITAKNYKEAVEKIKHLFDAKDTEKHEAIMETLYEYKNYGQGDEDIDRPINTMLKLFNLKFAKELTKHRKDDFIDEHIHVVSIKPHSDSVKEPIKLPKEKAEKQPKPKADKKPKEKALPKWVQKQEATENIVNVLPDEIIAFKKYLALHNKRVDRRKIELRVIDMNRMAVTQTVRKTSEFAKLFELVLDDLVKTANEIGNKVDTFVIPEKILSQIKEAINDYEELSSVTIIKSFLKGIYGGLSTPKRIASAKNLLKKINIYLDSNLSKNDRLLSYVKQVEKHINNWLKSEKWQITQAELNGFAGLAGIGMDGIGFIANEPISSDKIMSSVDFAKQTFVPMGFVGRFRTLIGDPPSPFRIMFYGEGGHGKSTLAIEFAHYLASQHKLKTLYVAGEEGLTSTFQDKVNRMKAIHPNLFFVQNLPSNLSSYDVVFFDSVDTLKIEPEDLRDIKKKYKNLSIATIHQVTKEGKFKGSNEYNHDSDAAFNVVNGQASSTKNRFGGKAPIKVIFEK